MLPAQAACDFPVTAASSLSSSVCQFFSNSPRIFTSDAFTDIDQRAVQDTADSAKSGPAIVIIEGFSYGLLSIVPSIIGICVAMVAAWFLAAHAAGDNPTAPLEGLLADRDTDALAAWLADTRRARHIRNDDTTLLRITLLGTPGDA